MLMDKIGTISTSTCLTIAPPHTSHIPISSNPIWATNSADSLSDCQALLLSATPLYNLLEWRYEKLEAFVAFQAAKLLSG
jgi:hypothetical protein